MISTKPLLNVLAVAGIACSFNVDATVIFDGTFSEGSFQNYYLEADGISGDGVAYPAGIAGHLTLVTDPENPSRTVMAATRILGDSKTHEGYRSEVSIARDPLDPLGSERWYSAGFYLPDNWDPHGSAVVLAQIPNTPDTFESGLRAATLLVIAQNGMIRLTNSYDYDKITSPPGIRAHSGIDYTQRVLASLPIQTGKWTYFDIHAVWAGNDSGSLEIWSNGVPVFAETGHINTFNDERGVYFKAGTYVYPSPDWTSLTTLFTGVRVGDGAESLQSMTMVPEPSEIALMSIGVVFLFGAVRRKQVHRNVWGIDAS
jgi:hypothetical protein